MKARQTERESPLSIDNVIMSPDTNDIYIETQQLTTFTFNLKQWNLHETNSEVLILNPKKKGYLHRLNTN